jgi:3-deoxy-manno-octulosonate cytidylyltransferase (CMP-KDO synthetase)
VLNEIGNALYFSRNSVPYAPEGNLNYPFLRHIGLYGFKVNTLLEITKLNPTLLEKAESLEQLRWLYYGYNIKIVTTEIETPNIDSPEDLELVMNRI